MSRRMSGVCHLQCEEGTLSGDTGVERRHKQHLLLLCEAWCALAAAP